MSHQISDPAESMGQDQFKGSHRAGYSSDKLNMLIDWLTRHPATTLASGEGKILLSEIERLRSINNTPTPAPPDMINDVAIFMEACGQAVNKSPAFTDENQAQVILYKELVREEFEELDDAIKAKDIAETADACADLIWVIAGLAHTLGINLMTVWREVAASNASKIPPDGIIRRRDDGKILKPDSFFPPNINKALGLKD
jgi:predicted HAD superfamily Cof-like phosphohydrolase